MDLTGIIELRHEGLVLEAGGKKQDRYAPVHQGAHKHFTKIGYMHTGNKVRGGITTSNYFKRSRNGNSREVAVQSDGSYIKMSRRPSGSKRVRGSINSEGAEIQRNLGETDSGLSKTVGVQTEGFHNHGEVHKPKHTLGVKVKHHGRRMRAGASSSSEEESGLSKGDWVTHPITHQRGQVKHVYKDNANEKGHLVEVDYGKGKIVNHREKNLTAAGGDVGKTPKK